MHRRYKTLMFYAVVAFTGAATASLLGTPRVVSISMIPTLNPGQHVLVLRIPFLRSHLHSVLVPKLRRGDIVVLEGPEGTKQLIKRIVALGGDRIHIKEGLLFLNGSAFYEPYAYHEGAYSTNLDDWPATLTGPSERDITVPVGMLFVMGDNRPQSLDSRLWGPVPLSDVTAKVLFKLP